jgi:hypothetical protein
MSLLTNVRWSDSLLQRVYTYVYKLPEPTAFILIIFIVTNIYILKLVGGLVGEQQLVILTTTHSLECFKPHSVFVLVRTVQNSLIVNVSGNPFGIAVLR